MAYTYITKHTSPNYTAGRNGVKINAITIHWWGNPFSNPSFGGVVNWLCNPTAKVSAHYVITGTGRQVAHLVNDADTAWHAGNWNANLSTLGLELDPRCRKEDYDVAAEVIADLWKHYGKLPLVPHNKWVATACPGNYDLARLKREAELKLNPPKPAPITIISKQTFAPRTFIVQADTKLVNIPADTVYNSTVHKKGKEITDVVEKLTASNGKTFYRTKYARDVAKKMYGFKGNVLKEKVVTVPPVITPPVTDTDKYKDLAGRVTALEGLVKTIADFLTSVFKTFRR